MAAAFQEDAGYRFVASQPEERQRVARWAMGISLDYGVRQGKVFTLGNPVRAAAVWLTPGAYPIPLPELIKCGALAGLVKFRPRTLWRLLTMAQCTERQHARLLPGPHWYLMILAVDPAQQGRGFGSRLLANGLEMVDQSGFPCGLDTMNPRALPLYQWHGFEVVREDRVPKGGPPFWMLIRPAK
jgi:ribosomal protein S18 acetylase RimI-like enzyme